MSTTTYDSATYSLRVWLSAQSILQANIAQQQSQFDILVQPVTATLDTADMAESRRTKNREAARVVDANLYAADKLLGRIDMGLAQAQARSQLPQLRAQLTVIVKALARINAVISHQGDLSAAEQFEWAKNRLKALDLQGNNEELRRERQLLKERTFQLPVYDVSAETQDTVRSLMVQESALLLAVEKQEAETMLSLGGLLPDEASIVQSWLGLQVAPTEAPAESPTPEPSIQATTTEGAIDA